MIKIGVISDTHIPNKSKAIPSKVFELFENVDMILHAGDILNEEVLIDLRALASVQVVTGNNDGYEIFAKYGSSKIIEVEGKRIGLTHGSGYNKTYMNAYSEFANEKVDCIVYGHSHIPHNEVIDNILFFNPGSPTDRRRQPKFSIGFIYVDESIRGEIVYF